MLTGELPGQRLEPPSKKVQIDVRLDEIVLRALEKKPELRYQQASVLKTEVETIVSGTGSSPIGARRPKPAWFNRVGMLFLAAGGIALLPTLFSLGTDRFVWHSGSLLAMTGLALFTRHQTWRVLAIGCNVLAAAFGISALGWFVMLVFGGKLPSGWSIGVAGLSDNVALAVILGLLQLLGFVAGVWALFRRDAREAFKTRRKQAETIATTPEPSSRREEAQTEFAKPSQSWGTWSPFQSPEVREICAHLTKAEINQFWLLGLLFGVWIMAATFGIPALIRSSPSPGNWIVASVFGILFVVSLPMLHRMMRQFLCSTGWARERGFTPEQLRLFSFCRGNLWKGIGVLAVGLLLIFAQHKAMISYLGLPDLSQWQKTNTAGLHPPRQPRTAITNALASFSFGPLIERTVTDLADLDKGVLVNLPLSGVLSDRDPARYDWFNRDTNAFPFMRQQGIDLFQGHHGLIGVDLRVVSLEGKDWRGLTPVGLRQKLDALRLPKAPASIVISNERLPFGFETREGALGILEVTDFNLPRGMKIRYKQVPKTDGESPKSFHDKEPADLRIAKTKLAALRSRYREQHPLVQEALKRVAELERLRIEEPNAPANLREAKANLAELRSDYGEAHPDVQTVLAGIKELERIGREEPNASPQLRAAKSRLAELRVSYAEGHPEIRKQVAVIEALERKK